ncbi:MAG TPA: hypothetical protein VM325_14340 [Alphaproteobacteria bacterium]|nr:hypothetical protein [Alphaproteobacteria bacterium]
MLRHAIYALMFAVLLFGTACSESTQARGPQKIGYSGNVQLDAVTEAIHRAGRKSQWVTKSVSPGVIEARRDWGGGKHNIMVDVLYDTKTYRIVHKSSKNLKHSERRVHSAYNIQVDALQKAIKDETWNF